MRTYLLYFIGAFILALGIKAIYNNQPQTEISVVLGLDDPETSLATIPENISYNFDVKPILSDKCYTCHGPDPKSVKGNLRLDISDHWYRISDANPNKQIIFSGKVSNSELVDRIRSTKASHQMPPPETNLFLTEREKQIIEKWIEQGAKWETHWAYIPPVKNDPPPGNFNTQSTSIIDRFVIKQMMKKGLKPAPKASKEILLRRLYFDLTGLPPSISEIDNFLNDFSEDAYEDVVDRLLLSPSYGERMASIWMDISRYADTNGYQDDTERTMWPWRDWVIHAYNKNLPYDKFITWQLAGDLIPVQPKNKY